MRQTAATKENLTTGSIWVDPGVPTLPEAELLIASLMLATGHHFILRYVSTGKLSKFLERLMNGIRNIIWHTHCRRQHRFL
ncbi:hypothetical protein ACLKA6_002679 [Drosophila palustris]